MEETKVKQLFEYLKLNPVFTIRDLVVWTEEKPFYFNCGHSAVRNLKRYIKHFGYFLEEKWIGKHEYKEFTLKTSNIVGQTHLFDLRSLECVG